MGPQSSSITSLAQIFVSVVWHGRRRRRYPGLLTGGLCLWSVSRNIVDTVWRDGGLCLVLKRICYCSFGRRSRLEYCSGCSEVWVSWQWVHQLVQRYRSGGVAAVLPQSKALKSRLHTTTEAVRARVIELRQTLVADGADAGPKTIAWHQTRKALKRPGFCSIL